MISLFKRYTFQALIIILIIHSSPNFLLSMNLGVNTGTLRRSERLQEHQTHQQAQNQAAETAPPQTPPRREFQIFTHTPSPRSTRIQNQNPVSPVVENKYKRLEWQEVIDRVAKIIEQNYPTNLRDDEALDALWIKAFFGDNTSLYEGQRFYSRTIFHLLAHLNDQAKAQEIWELLVAQYAQKNSITANDERNYLHYLDRETIFDCQSVHGSPLHIAIKKGNYEMVKWLISLRANSNHTCTHQPIHQRNRSVSACALPPLHYALSLDFKHGRSVTNMTKIVRLLLKAGANPSLQTTDGNDDTALHIAFRHLHPASQYLAEKTPDLTLENRLGNTAFHVLSQHREVIGALNIGKKFIHSFKKAWNRNPEQFTQTRFPENFFSCTKCSIRFNRALYLPKYKVMSGNFIRRFSLFRSLKNFRDMLRSFNRWINKQHENELQNQEEVE